MTISVPALRKRLARRGYYIHQHSRVVGSTWYHLIDAETRALIWTADLESIAQEYAS